MLLRAICGKSRLILLGLVLVAAVMWFLLRSGQSPKEIRNVVLISIDTCRADYLSCYGYPRQTTPNIDAFAAEGIVFENTISPVPITLPAHSSMLTGTIPPYHGVHDNFEYRLGQSNVTLAEILRQHGYQTAAIVGAFVMDSQFGLAQGFEVYNDRFDKKEVKHMGYSERRAEEVSRYGMKWLDQHHREPFFLFLHYFDPHMFYDPPEPFKSRCIANDPSSFYAGEISYTDYCIGQVIAKLKQLRLYDSSLIIITGDHGEMLGEHGEPNHSYFIYQSAIKVPLIFKLPGRRKPKNIKDLVGIIDIVPTVCSLLGIKPANQMQGQDLSSALLGENLPNRERHMYCESFCPTIYNANSLLGVVTNHFKYIQTTRPELYNLVKDPHEGNNLIKQQPEQGHILRRRLKQILVQSLSKHPSGSSMELDEQSRRRLESLGYVSGGVKEDFEFDQSKDDPKDLIGLHSSTAYVFELIVLKRYAEAKALCQKMISERPDYAGSYRHLSRITEEEGDKEKAIYYLVETLKVSPNQVQVRNKLAAMLIQQRKTKEAIKHFTESLRIKPDQFDTHQKLGSLLQSNGKLDEAISHYRQALRIKPDFAKAHNSLAGALARQGKLDEAITHFIEAVRLDPGSARAHYILARALQDGGRIKEAIAEFKETLRLGPNWVIPMNSLAWLLATHKEDKFRNPEEAIRLAERACELTNYGNAGLVDTLAAAYAAAGRFPDAVKTTERAIDLAKSANQQQLADEIKKRLELYKTGQPYYD